MRKAHSKVTHIKQQKYFHHLKGHGYNKNSVLYPWRFRWWKYFTQSPKHIRITRSSLASTVTYIEFAQLKKRMVIVSTVLIIIIITIITTTTTTIIIITTTPPPPPSSSSSSIIITTTTTIITIVIIMSNSRRNTLFSQQMKRCTVTWTTEQTNFHHLNDLLWRYPTVVQTGTDPTVSMRRPPA